MGVFVLIICCFYAISGLVNIGEGMEEDESAVIVGGLIKLVLGILAIIFQSILL